MAPLVAPPNFSQLLSLVRFQVRMRTTFTTTLPPLPANGSPLAMPFYPTGWLADSIAITAALAAAIASAAIANDDPLISLPFSLSNPQRLQRLAEPMLFHASLPTNSAGRLLFALWRLSQQLPSSSATTTATPAALWAGLRRKLNCPLPAWRVPAVSPQAMGTTQRLSNAHRANTRNDITGELDLSPSAFRSGASWANAVRPLAAQNPAAITLRCLAAGRTCAQPKVRRSSQ